MHRGFSIVALAFAAAVPVGVAAQAYPAKPVRMVVPFSPGGATDTLARLVSSKLHERLGQPVVVETRAGGGGNIGASYVAKQPADGYTLLAAGIPQAIGMSLFTKLDYHLARDLTPISQMATFPSVIAVHPSLPAKSLSDLIRLAKQRPGELNFGANPGSPNQLSIELIKVLAGVDMVHIGYKGGGPVVTDLVGGQLHFSSLGLPPSVAQVKAGRLRAIAVTGDKRSPLLPDVPTVAETGGPFKDFKVTSWYGVFGPANLPQDVVAKLNGEVRAILGLKDVEDRLATLGAAPEPTSPAEFAKIVDSEIARWAGVVRDAKVRRR